MKGFVTAILFIMFVLVCTNAIHIGTENTVAVKVCAVQDADAASTQGVNEDTIIPLHKDNGVADMEVGDAHSLAHRVSASAERMYRFSSIETTQFLKNLLRRMAVRMDNLTNCHTRVYDTSRCLNWSDACEHYIFGMRRILI